MTPFQTYLRRVASHWSIYAIGQGLTLVSSILSLLLLTRLLPVQSYGRLAILLVFSSLLHLTYNLGVYQGTNHYGFSSSDHDNLFPELDREEGRRVAMGCGITLTALVGLVGTTIVIPLSRPLAGLLLHDRGLWPAIVFASLEGIAGATFRLGANMLRLERRPVAWSLVQASRPAVALVAAIVLIELGYGVTGAIAGWFIGSTAMLVFTFVVVRRSFRLAFHWRAVAPIYKSGAPMIPAAIGFWIMASGDIFIASQVVSLRNVGRYRVAARLGSFIYPFTHAFIYGWGTLRRDPVYLAATKERSRNAVDSHMVTFYGVFVFGAVLFLAVFVHQILYIVPSQYRTIELLVPILGLRWGTRALLQSFYRVLEYEKRRLDFGLCTFAAAALTMAGAAVLGRAYGLYGLAGGIATGPLIALAFLAVVAAKRKKTPDLEFARVGLAGVLAAACAIADAMLTRDSLAFGVLWIVVYGLLCVVTGALPFGRVLELFNAIRARAMPTGELLQRVAQLPAYERSLVVTLVTIRNRRTVETLSPEDLSTFVRALCVVGGFAGGPPATDAAVARYVLWTGAPAQRDAYSYELFGMGVEPAELDDVNSVYRRLRRKRRRLKHDVDGAPPELVEAT